MPRPSLGLRLLLTVATRFFFLVFFILPPRVTGERERDFGVLEIDRGIRGRGVADRETDLIGMRVRVTKGVLDRDLLMERNLGPLEGDLDMFLRKCGGVLFLARNLGENDRLLLTRRGGSGLNEIEISRLRSGVRVRLRVLERGFGVTSLPNGSLYILGRFSAITVRTS